MALVLVMCCHSPTCYAIGERNATRWCLFRLHFALRAECSHVCKCCWSGGPVSQGSTKREESHCNGSKVQHRNGIVVVPRFLAPVTTNRVAWLDGSRAVPVNSKNMLWLEINLSGFRKSDRSRSENPRSWLIADRQISSRARKIYTFQIDGNSREVNSPYFEGELSSGIIGFSNIYSNE